MVITAESKPYPFTNQYDYSSGVCPFVGLVIFASLWEFTQRLMGGRVCYNLLITHSSLLVPLSKDTKGTFSPGVNILLDLDYLKQ